jgi:hypothetical protein
MFCSVETLAEAWNFDWSVDIRLDEGKRGLKHKQDINVTQLVLAGERCRAVAVVVEAVPADKVRDGVKLRWRDKINKTLFTRPRLELALICPDAK